MTKIDHDISGPRVARARRFSHEIMSLMRDFIPRDGETMRRIENMLFETGYKSNAQIISVPPECDELDKLALEKWMLQTTIQRLEIKI